MPALPEAERVVVVDDAPCAHRIALYRQIARHAPFTLTVVWLSARGLADGVERRAGQSGFEEFFTRSLRLYRPGPDAHLQLNFGLGRLLRRLRPRVIVVGGYHLPAYWLCLVHARLHRLPLLLWIGTAPANEVDGGRPARLVKAAFVRACRGALAYGSESACYLAGLGLPPDAVHTVINTTDLTAIRHAAAAAARPPDDGVARLAFVGRLVPNKGVGLLLDALAGLDGALPFRLRVLGDGPLRAELEARSRALGLSDRVEFAGFVAQPDLPAHLAWADLLVLPSRREVWGIVINEALAAGAYVVASRSAGACADLLDRPEMGATFPPGDRAGLAQVLAAALADLPALRAGRDLRSSRVMRFCATTICHDFIAAVAPISRI